MARQTPHTHTPLAPPQLVQTIIINPKMMRDLMHHRDRNLLTQLLL